MGPPGCPGRWLQGLSTAAPVTPGTDPGKVGGGPGYQGLEKQTRPNLKPLSALGGGLGKILAFKDNDRRRKREKVNNLTNM